MGNQWAASTADTFAKRGEAASAVVAQNMADKQREVQLRLRELQMATAMARARDLTKWFGAAWCTAGVLGGVAFAKRGNPAGLVALVPLGFVTAFNYDAGYGNKLQRIRAEASAILAEERAAHRGFPARPVRFMPPDNNLFVSRAEYFDVFRETGRGGAQAAGATRATRTTPAGHPKPLGGTSKGKCPMGHH